MASPEFDNGFLLIPTEITDGTVNLAFEEKNEESVEVSQMLSQENSGEAFTILHEDANHELPEATESEQDHQARLRSIEKPGHIVVELGPERALLMLPLEKIPANACALVDVLQKPPGSRNTWFKYIDPIDFGTYLDADERKLSGQDLGCGLGWLELVKLGVVAETVEDTIMQLKCRVALRHKIFRVGNGANALFNDDVVQYAYAHTGPGSPLRLTLVEIAVNHKTLIGSLSAPVEFYDDCSLELSSREAVHENIQGKPIGFSPENPKRARKSKSASTLAFGATEASDSAFQIPRFLTTPFWRVQANETESPEPAMSGSSHSRVPSILISEPDDEPLPLPRDYYYSTDRAAHIPVPISRSAYNQSVDANQFVQARSPVSPLTSGRSGYGSPLRFGESASVTPNTPSTPERGSHTTNTASDPSGSRTFVSTLPAVPCSSPTRRHGHRVKFVNSPRGTTERLESLNQVGRAATRRHQRPQKESPIRQPINPPPVDELQRAPTTKYPGGKNFVSRRAPTAKYSGGKNLCPGAKFWG